MTNQSGSRQDAEKQRRDYLRKKGGAVAALWILVGLIGTLSLSILLELSESMSIGKHLYFPQTEQASTPPHHADGLRRGLAHGRLH